MMLKKIIKDSLTMLTTAAIVMASGTVSLVSAQSLRVGVGSAGSASAISAGVASSKSNTQAPKRNLFSSSSSGGNNSLALRIGVAHEPINYASLGYTEEVEDLRVKVHAGYVKVRRTYKNKRWYVNRRWSPLKEVYETKGRAGPKFCNYPGCGGDGSLKLKLPVPGDEPKPTALSRNGYEYKRVSDTLYVFGQHQQQRITKTATGYRWENTTGDWIEYDQQRRATRYGGRNAATFVRLQYDGNGFFSGVFDALDQQVLWVTTNAKGHIESIRDKDLRTVSYSFVSTPSDVGGAGDPFAIPRLSTVTDVRGHVWKYGYDSEKRLSSITDPEQRIKIITHSKVGAVASEKVRKVSEAAELAVGNEYGYEFNEAREELYFAVRHSGGMLRERWFNTDGIPVREDMNGQTLYAIKVENGGRKWIRTDSIGAITVDEFDGKENLIKRTYPDNATEIWTYDSYANVLSHTNENGVVTSNIYDGSGNLTRKTEAQGSPDERVTEYVYDIYGNILEQKQLADANTALAVTKWTYDNYGNRLTATDAEGNVTTYTYDGLGNVLTKRDARGKVWVYSYDNSGKLLTEKDPLNQVTTYTYNKVGKLVQLKAADNTTTKYAYDGLHRLIKVTDALNRETSYSYTLGGQITARIDEEGDAVDIAYDLSGRVINVADAEANRFDIEYDNNTLGISRVPARIKFLSVNAEFEYDKRYRHTAVSYRAQGVEPQVTRKQYDDMGNLTRVTDALNRATTYQYDDLNRLIKTIDVLNGETVYTYDDRSNLLSLTDANNTTRFEYDRDDRVLKEIRPMGEEKVYVYGAAGYLEHITTENGDRITYEYDDAGRKNVEKHYLAASLTTPIKTISYTYNALNNLTGYSDGTTTGSYTYDDLQRKTREVVNYGTFSLEHSYTYTKRGEVKSYTGPDAVTLNYTYDKAGRLKTISQAGQGTISINEYLGYQPKKLTLPGGSTQETSYDPLLRLVALHSKDGAGNTIMQHTLTRDAMGNILTKETEHGHYEYTYDLFDRLLTAKNPNLPDESYTYDAVGNRLTDASGAQYDYNGNNELLSHAGITYQYDNNGNRTRKTENGQHTYYKYNVRNNVTEVQDHSQSPIAQYYSDPFSHRLSKTLPSETVHYHYSDEGLVGDFDANGSRIRSYTYLPVQNFWQSAPVSVFEPNQGYAYFHRDVLGTPQKATASNGALKWSAQYQAFGQASINSAQMVNNLRFPGQYFDQETGTHYNYFRDYDPRLGRYITSDPIGLLGGLNTYLYANANPIRYIDPEGLNAAGAGAAAVLLFCTRYRQVCAAGVLALCRALGGCEVPIDPMQNSPEEPESNEKKEDREQKPEGCPTGTKPIDKDKRLDREKIHTIKDQLGARPKDWVGISPDGRIWTNEGGEAADNGPFGDYIN